MFTLCPDGRQVLLKQQSEMFSCRYKHFNVPVKTAFHFNANTVPLAPNELSRKAKLILMTDYHQLITGYMLKENIRVHSMKLNLWDDSAKP